MLQKMAVPFSVVVKNKTQMRSRAQGSVERLN